jgi:hypothetical protein
MPHVFLVVVVIDMIGKYINHALDYIILDYINIH